MTDLLTLPGVTTAAVDVYYLEDGSARAAAVLAPDPSFARVTAEVTVMVRGGQPAPYEPGQFFRRELPPIQAVLSGVAGLGLLIVDGYVDLDPHGRKGLGAHAHAALGVPVIGVAKSPFAAATHAAAVRRGTSARPLYVTAAGLPVSDAAELIRRMPGRFRLPDPLRRADALSRGSPVRLGPA
jgi:deoxyribonuclease V